MRSVIGIKILAVLGTTVLLGALLARIGFLVDERQASQAQAVDSVRQSLAHAQTLLGPVLRRECEETWPVTEAHGPALRTRTESRRFAVQAVPAKLQVQARAHNERRYRGLFSVNTFTAGLKLQASWPRLDVMQPVPEHADGTLRCGAPTLWFSASDVRGLRSATLDIDGQGQAVRPGVGHDSALKGLHARLDAPQMGWLASGGGPQALEAMLTLEIVGTARLALVPLADHTQWSLQSDWPHPSFTGRFLPGERSVRADGFDAHWQLSSLATSAGTDLLRGEAACLSKGQGDCLDTLAVDFIEPVNHYVLSDRALKYGLLFVLLTYAAVAMAEVLGRGRVKRVHPLQYGLIGLTLSLFFLLLLSLSEHLSFGLAYALSSAACVPLLTLYTRHMLGRLRDGLGFGAGMALLYGLLFVLLQREQTALLIGSIGLFACVATVMLLTRKVDWYALSPSATAPAAPRPQ